jgi:class 3 adenylate cyclase
VLVSDEFARLAGLDAFDALGAFSLKGLAEPRSVYAPKTQSPR